jgi:alpha-glucosidase
MLCAVDSWWRSAVIYQVYPRSFADSDGDGVGDLPGITSRLPYLAELGVDAIWLSPFYRSPMVDGGYDIADHRDVDPLFGTLADVDALLARAHGLGLRVIVDIVPNHTSAAHPWFREALAGDGRDRYIFSNVPNNWQSLFGGPAWTRVADGSWYLHLFDPAQPDLNWRNPQVREEFAAILRFWLDRGVDGFRVDVAHGLVKAVGLPDLAGGAAIPYFDQDEVHEVYREWRKILEEYPGERMAVAEVFDSTPERVARYIRGDELHQAFNFDYLEAPWDAGILRRIIDASLAATDNASWVLSNHDRQRHRTRFGSVARARAAAVLTLALPGSAYVYQGDELGLPEVLDIPAELRRDPGKDRDGCRVPLPWLGDAPPFGFGPSARSWLPMPADWAGLTVQAQRDDPGSVLALYKQILRARKRLGGPLVWLPAQQDVLLFGRDGGFVCAANLSGAPVALPAGEVVVASGPLPDGELPPDTAVWVR